MKKICLLMLFLCAAFPLNAWVFLDSVEKDGSDWLLPKMLSGQSVRVCVDVLEAPQNGKPALYTGPQQDAYYAMSAQIVYSAYQSWFDNVREQIRLTGRKKEFKELLSRLPKSVPFQFVNIGPAAGAHSYLPCSAYPKEEIDLHIRAVLNAGDAPLPQYGSSPRTFAFPLNPNHTGLMPGRDAGAGNSSLQIALHEAGHTLGLASRQAQDTYGKASPVYGFAAAQTDKQEASVMERQNMLSCDDAEGLVNLVDYFSFKPDARSQSGWLGFCPQRSVVYAQGVAVPVSAQQAQAQEEFVAQGRQAEAPLEGPIAAALDRAAQYQRVKRTAQQKAKENVRSGLVKAISSEMEQQK